MAKTDTLQRILTTLIRELRTQGVLPEEPEPEWMRQDTPEIVKLRNQIDELALELQTAGDALADTGCDEAARIAHERADNARATLPHTTISYRNYEIKPSGRAAAWWDWRHWDYDGPDDVRYGTERSIAACKREIDQLIADQPEIYA